MRKHFRVPPFAKNAKDRSPILSVMPVKSKAWATRPIYGQAFMGSSMRWLTAAILSNREGR